MNISSFDDLLTMARQQQLPQRLLFVFAGIELPADSTPEQLARFEAGQGGALVPLMCVDKSPSELDSFSALVSEASQFDQQWGMVFAAAMSGTLAKPPSSADAEVPLQRMVEAIKQGDIGAYIPFDLQGSPVHFG